MNKLETSIQGNIFNYSEYVAWMEELVRNGRTSGSKQTEALAGFTALNLKRTQRLDKTAKIEAELKELLSGLEQPQDWWVITEAWCGDGAQNIPVMAKMAAESNGMIRLHMILRDKNPDLMDRYLTNGARSIPKLAAFDPSGNELFTWGPRPEPAQQLLLDWKAAPGDRSWDDFEKELHTWYAKDKTQTMQQEFIALLKKNTPVKAIG
ncbi:thioredoxin family protein [Sinomicrobium weinanense]|uniref:Thioredoxin family protein n=1 Tax=Sinomicrobium weinanense TaxID=2842200 RepID=A0A926JPR6_9FLAO|nr:thioredoxin family protein [Sinomicrobium weinanense]MBC9794991.1 thioredoxin family protein [Sinomicrobium weinanense]MBU3125148.1 thioredoxin family protein [Sinomicrobium weinanense]